MTKGIFLTAITTLLIATSVSAQRSAPAYAQEQLVVEIPKEPTVNLSDASHEWSGKLAPALQAAEQANSVFVGLTEQGNAIIELPSGVPASTAKASLAEVSFPAESLSIQEARIPVRRLVVVSNVQHSAQETQLAGFTIVGRYDDAKLLTIESPDGFSADEIRKLALTPNATFVEPDYPAVLQEFNENPNDPEYRAGKMWALDNIRVSKAWKPHATPVGTTGTIMLVAVLDSGVDYTHPDLVRNIWTNSRENPGNNIDDDNNGCVDDVHGCDFTAEADKDAIDKRGHGTHVAGLIDVSELSFINCKIQEPLNNI